MWPATFGTSLNLLLGAKKPPTEKGPRPPSGKDERCFVPKTFTSVANQITNFMKENFLKDEAASQTPSIQNRKIQSDLCCLNHEMIAVIIDQVSVSSTYVSRECEPTYDHIRMKHLQVGSDPQKVVATLNRQLGRSLRNSEWPILQQYYIEYEPASAVALVGTKESFVNKSGAWTRYCNSYQSCAWVRMDAV